MDIDYDELYYYTSEFSKNFEPWFRKQLIGSGEIKRYRSSRLNLSEIITILLAYHRSGTTCFKYFYFSLSRELFPDLVHYSRFVKLVKKAFLALICMLKSLEGEVTEFLFIDSTPMAVCHNLRQRKHKVFKGIATKGKTSTGWFFGFKLHFLFNTKGEIVRLTVTSANVHDTNPVADMMQGIKAKLIGDKGYISKKLFSKLFEHGSILITKIKKNMKNILMDMSDKMMLMKRSFVETIFSSMKSLNTLIHHRHRCPTNAFAHLFAGLIVYQIRDDKPTLESFMKIAP